MDRTEFIGKLQMVYVGDRNAFNEIVEDNQKLKNEVVYSKVEIDRLNNIINELEKYIKTEAKIELYKDKNGFRTFADSDDILNKLKELKVNK